jgi:hypothetical protein
MGDDGSTRSMLVIELSGDHVVAYRVLDYLHRGRFIHAPVRKASEAPDRSLDDPEVGR